MKKEKAKREPRTRPNPVAFVVGWILIWWLVLLSVLALDFTSSYYVTLGNALVFVLGRAVFFAALSTLQMLWVRRHFRIQLRHWIPLSLLGVLAGTTAFMLLDWYVLGPHVSRQYSQLWVQSAPEAVRAIRLQYVEDYFAHGALLWSLPVMFQWAALRKEYRRHALWLLAALAHNPFALGSLILFTELPQKVESFREMGISYSYLPDPPVAALLLDIAIIPCLLTGLALYWILSRRRDSDGAH
ncbi:MAG: hypothetical protein F4X02_09920 [Chloroflexi bacterium]|nr:hypothetical protein [Chloroflexota bacterium]